MKQIHKSGTAATPSLYKLVMRPDSELQEVTTSLRSVFLLLHIDGDSQRSLNQTIDSMEVLKWQYPVLSLLQDR